MIDSQEASACLDKAAQLPEARSLCQHTLLRLGKKFKNRKFPCIFYFQSKLDKGYLF